MPSSCTPILRGLVALSGFTGEALALLGRHSLYVFVRHDCLLEVDTFLRTRLHWAKGLPGVTALFCFDLLILLLAVFMLEHSDAIRAGAHAFLLETSRLVQVRYVSFARPAGVALVALLFVYTSGAFASTRGEVLIDDFEAADSCPHWWTFGPLAFQRLAADSAGTEHGTRVLDIEGFAAAPSGTGVYLQQDIGSLRTLRTLRLDVRGCGPGSGRLRIELYDDDNGNWEIEKDPKTFEPLYDDRFVFEMPVDWVGWRKLVLPASVFHDDNPGIGNDVFDPERDQTSGGLLEMQFLVFATSDKQQHVHVQIDNVRRTP